MHDSETAQQRVSIVDCRAPSRSSKAAGQGRAGQDRLLIRLRTFAFKGCHLWPQLRITRLAHVLQAEDVDYFKFRAVNRSVVSVRLAKSLENLVDGASPQSVLKFRMVCDYDDGDDTVSTFFSTPHSLSPLHYHIRSSRLPNTCQLVHRHSKKATQLPLICAYKMRTISSLSPATFLVISNNKYNTYVNTSVNTFAPIQGRRYARPYTLVTQFSSPNCHQRESMYARNSGQPSR